MVFEVNFTGISKSEVKNQANFDFLLWYGFSNSRKVQKMYGVGYQMIRRPHFDKKINTATHQVETVREGHCSLNTATLTCGLMQNVEIIVFLETKRIRKYSGIVNVPIGYVTKQILLHSTTTSFKDSLDLTSWRDHEIHIGCQSLHTKR